MAFRSLSLSLSDMAADDQAFVLFIICKNVLYVKIYSYKTSYNNSMGAPFSNH